jgi:hypothetical protein
LSFPCPKRGQEAAQQTPGVMQIGARRSLGDAEKDANLTMAETFDVVQNDHRPLPVREPSERVAQARAQVGSFGGVTCVRGKRLR